MIGQFSSNSTPTSRSTTKANINKPELKIVSWSCNTENGYHVITGEVKNISANKIDNVMAVGVYTTATNEVVKTENTLISYNPIMSQQISPFKVMASPNPQIKNCKLSFKHMFGGQIATENK